MNERTRGLFATGPAVSVAALATVLLANVGARGDYEAVGFAASKFYNDEGAGYCPGDNNTHMDAYLEVFLNEAEDTWAYDYIRPYGSYSRNQAVDGRDFTDPDQYAWGEDYVSPYGSDFADAIFLATHGTAWCMEMESCYSYTYHTWRCCSTYSCGSSAFDCGIHNWSRLMMGDDEHCEIFTNDHIVFGDADANVFLTRSCNSLTPCVWVNGGYSDMAAGSFNTYLAFYGRHDYYTGTESAFEDYVTGTKYNDIGEDWLTDNYYDNAEDGKVCPMVNIWCSTESNCNNQFDNGGFKDFKNTSGNSLEVLYWVAGCDPNSEGYNCTTANRDRPDLPVIIE